MKTKLDPKTITLNGGLDLRVLFEKPSPEAAAPAPASIKVRQIPVREYEAGFRHLKDEAALVGFLCGKDKTWALTLTPDAFEEILELGTEVNERGFFTSARRRADREQKEQAAWVAVLATLPQETVKLAMEAGLANQNPSRSPSSWPGPLPPPAR